MTDSDMDTMRDVEVGGWALRYRSGAWEERLVRDYLVTHATMLLFVGFIVYVAIVLGQRPFSFPDLVVPFIVTLIVGVLIGDWDGKRVERRAQASTVVARIGSPAEAIFPIIVILVAVSAALPDGNPSPIGWTGLTIASLYAGFLVGVPLGVSRYEGGRHMVLWVRDHAPATALRRAKVSYFVGPA